MKETESDIVERLVAYAPPLGFEGHDPTFDVRQEAASEMRHLRKVNADLYEALKALVDKISDYEHENNLNPNPGKGVCWIEVLIARAALARAEGKHTTEME